MTVLDVSKQDASLTVLNERAFEEFYKVSIPEGLRGQKRREAEERLDAAGFRREYHFMKRVVDRRSQTLAKAQAASIVVRIQAKAGVAMQTSHVLRFFG